MKSNDQKHSISECDQHGGTLYSEQYVGGAYRASELVNQLDIISRHSTIHDLHDDVEDDGKHDDEVEEGEYPIDGWFAMIISICTMMLVVSCWGVNSAYGVFLDFYISADKFPGATQYDYALIGGLVVFLAQFLAPINIIAFKIFGFKWVTFVGILVQSIAYILASFSTKLWHLFLTQGVLVGISFSFVFIPGTLVLPTWVKKRRATAMSIAVAGSGLGGVIFSLSVNGLIEKTGDQKWALRMCGIVTFFLAMLALLIMRPRRLKNPPTLKDTLTKENLIINIKAIFSIKVFKNYSLVLLSFWYAMALVGYLLIIFSLPSYATSVGLKSSQGAALSSILNAAQVVGRPIMGLMADKIGRTNVTSGISLLIAILIFAFWINAMNYATLIGFSALVGLVMGIGSSMAQPIAADILEDFPQNLPAAWSGMNIFISFFCLIAEVITLLLKSKTSSRPFFHSQIFAGFCFIACFILMMIVREWLVRDKLKKRLNIAHIEYEQLKLSRASTPSHTDSQSLEKVNSELNKEVRILEETIDRYNTLLQNTLWSYLVRIFYPMKV
ncbi:monocarboxylate transporter [Scheffersomyces coipomensis]|uniref:monocarboxylate transporter n=1 Tax=Scheffersomyces coipomensis TaxID=1788519 RepID=UPI00315D087A